MKHGTNGMRAADSVSSGEGIMDGWRMSLSASVSILLVYRDTGLLRHVLFQVLPFLLRALDLVEPLGDLEARPAVDFALEFALFLNLLFPAESGAKVDFREANFAAFAFQVELQLFSVAFRQGRRLELSSSIESV